VSNIIIIPSNLKSFKVEEGKIQSLQVSPQSDQSCEMKVYNMTEWELLPTASITYDKTDSPPFRYSAIISFKKGTEEIVSFYSYHNSFEDAKHTINFGKEGKVNGKLRQIVGKKDHVYVSEVSGTTGTNVSCGSYIFNIE